MTYTQLILTVDLAYLFLFLILQPSL